jgi:hypothetical protein
MFHDPKPIDAELINGRYNYDPLTGIFTYAKKCNKMLPGEIAGYKNKSGYIVMSMNASLYFAHRLAWFMHYAENPLGVVDHINRVKTDNRIENLRIISRSENIINQPLKTKAKSGYRGVYWSNGQWVARIIVRGNYITLGASDDPLEASRLYKEYIKVNYPTTHNSLYGDKP